MSGGNKKITHTWTNLQLKAAGLFKYVWPFCYQQRLKVYGNIIDVFRTLPNIFLSKKFHHRRLTFPKRYCTIRKSHRKCSLKKGFLKNFAIFTGKHLCWSFFLTNCIKKRFQHKYFPGSIVKLLRILLWRASANDCFYRSEEGREGRLFYKNEKKSLTGILKSCLKIEISILS